MRAKRSYNTPPEIFLVDFGGGMGYSYVNSYFSYQQRRLLWKTNHRNTTYLSLIGVSSVWHGTCRYVV